MKKKVIGKCKYKLWAGQWKDTGELTPQVWLRKATARYNLGPHMKIVQVEIKVCK